jgi:hypothetical protein
VIKSDCENRPVHVLEHDHCIAHRRQRRGIDENAIILLAKLPDKPRETFMIEDMRWIYRATASEKKIEVRKVILYGKAFERLSRSAEVDDTLGVGNAKEIVHIGFAEVAIDEDRPLSMLGKRQCEIRSNE